MRLLIAVLIWFVFSARVTGSPPEKFHYIGEVKLSLPNGQPFGSQVILLEKTHDPDGAKIIESAIVLDAKGKAEQRTMQLSVNEDNSFSLVDDQATIEGTGMLFGPRWRWTYFKGTWKSTSGVIVEDENFMTDDAIITARKKVSGADGKVLMYMEMSLSRIAPNSFAILKTALLK